MAETTKTEGPDPELYPLRPAGVYLSAMNSASRIVSENSGVWIPIILVLGVIMLVTFFPIQLAIIAVGGDQAGEIDSAYGIALTALALPAIGFIHALCTGTMLAGVKAINGGRVELGDIFVAIKTIGASTLLNVVFLLVPTLIVTLAESLLSLAGLQDPIVPAIIGDVIGLAWTVILTGVYYYAVPYSFLTGTPFFTSLRIAFLRTFRHSLVGFLLGILVGLILVISMFLCLIPLLWTAPMAFLVVAAHFRYFFPELADYGMPPGDAVADPA